MNRPSPDDILSTLQQGNGARGRLKVFIGASAGVGKTFAMLSEAHQHMQRGLNAAIGFIETHGRAETGALTDGLPQIPLKEISYRGASLLEPDIDEIIRQRPELVLIDELPHTNAEGSRHRKRWQDIEEILDAGIDVYTAMNIQHLESLNDVVAQVTGVRVQEKVPDAFLERADEIEVIDIPPAELQQRLKEGKVYVPQNVEQALSGFFKASNLAALRELALRRAADSVDAEVRRLRTQAGAQGPWATKERVVVCVAPNRMASRVVRAAARFGSSSHAELIAVYVDSERQRQRPEAEHQAVREALDLAARLGMEVATLSGHDIVAELMAFAHRRNATLIIVGKPIRPRWREILFGSVVDELVRASGDVDVHVITADGQQGSPSESPPKSEAGITLHGSAATAAALAASTGIGLALYQGFGITNVAMIYLLGVALCATHSSRLESAIAAVLSVLSFNFFFVDPRYTFAVSDIRYLILFFVMLTVALVISSLTHRLRRQLQASSDRERRTQSLYVLSRQLAIKRSKRELAASAANEIRSVFKGEVAVFLYKSNRLSLLEGSQSGFEADANESAVAAWVGEHGSPAGLGTDTLPGSCAQYLPLAGSEATVGVLAFKPGGDLPSLAERQLLDTFANALGLALERAVLAKASNDARIEAETERMRSTILSSISHDLRTPLTSITGAASGILSGSAEPKLLAATIFEQSVRLDQQIQNLLDMTRLQGRDVALKREWHSPPDLVASALRHVAALLEPRQVSVKIEPGLGLLFVDGLLVEKALVNLLENVGRHTEPDGSVEVDVACEGGQIRFTVADTGPGLPEGVAGSVFQLGMTSKAEGHGLGLAVVKAIADLHGGQVFARNRQPRGAEFLLVIPLPDKQPEAPVG